jgi:hypothetical protein
MERQEFPLDPQEIDELKKLDAKYSFDYWDSLKLIRHPQRDLILQRTEIYARTSGIRTNSKKVHKFLLDLLYDRQLTIDPC